MEEVAFGRYRLIAEIGKGGMGKVYRAHDTLLDRSVAIKVLAPEMATQPGFAQRFRREASTAARLTEPHIVPIHDAGEVDGQLYLVMPIIDGTDVQTLLRRDGPMSPDRAVAVVEQLGAALEAAHAAGLVHRDVKPSNALVTGNNFVYLIDFGIAHEANATRMTSTGKMVGTLAYMSPERLSSGIGDARGDVYALACVLYECLTGATPYPGDSLEQQIAGHLMMDPPRPSEHGPGVPVGLDQVIAAGMAKRPEQRFQSAGELAAAARRALTVVDQQPAFVAQPLVQAPEAPAPAKPRRTSQRTAIAAGVTAFVALIAVGAVAASYLLGQPSTTAQTSAARVGAAPTTSVTPAPPVEQSALDGLMLSVDQINSALGATEIVLTRTETGMYDDTAKVSDKACLPLLSVAQVAVYAGSGWANVLQQELHSPGAKRDHFAQQTVVLFPSAQQASAFFTASTRSWAACASRQFDWNSDPGKPAQTYTVGTVFNGGGILSARKVITASPAWSWDTCQRALTVANNVVVDVQACSQNLSDVNSDAAVSIARQIAAKVPGK